MISPGSMPRDLGGEARARSHSITRNSPVEMSSARERELRAASSDDDARARTIADEIVVAPRIEQRVLGERAGGDQPRDAALHDALCAALLRLGRILGLLAHRDAEARRDQLVQILVRAHHRHAAHRDVGAVDACRAWSARCRARGGDLGVLEEQLVEIAHPVEQQAIRIRRLDLQILLHHRRDGRLRRQRRAAAVSLDGTASDVIGSDHIHAARR